MPYNGLAIIGDNILRILLQAKSFSASLLDFIPN
jgi:hypothetical protein